DRILFGYFRYGNIPPSKSWHSLLTVYLYIDHGGGGNGLGLFKSSFKFFNISSFEDVRTHTGGIGRIVYGQCPAIQLIGLLVPISVIGTEALAPQGSGKASDTRIPVIVQSDDGQFSIFLDRGDNLLGHHHRTSPAYHYVDHA